MTLNICDGAKHIYSKKQKKTSIRREDTLRISVVVICRYGYANSLVFQKRFQKKESLSARKERLVHEAGHVSRVKNAAS